MKAKTGQEKKAKILFQLTNPECRDSKALAKLGIESWTPIHKTAGAACADFRAADTLEIPPGMVRAIKTGIRLVLPQGYELHARSRSGLFINSQVFVLGTIDDDYRGEIKILMMNAGTEPFRVNFGDRIAQFKLSRYVRQNYVEATDEEFEKSATERGTSGFNSTGVKG